MTSNFLYLRFIILYPSSLWRTDTIVFSAKLNKPPSPLSNKPLASSQKGFNLKGPRGALIEDLRYNMLLFLKTNIDNVGPCR